ncbi:MAG: hypothetical protein ACREEM_04825 [Blastocatellia bacterium]
MAAKKSRTQKTTAVSDFPRFHLSSYQTDDPKIAEKLIPQVIKETSFWINEFGFSQQQRDETQILSGKMNRTKNEKGQFVVLAIIPLEADQAFPAVWSGMLNETLGEDITFDLKQTGV